MPMFEILEIRPSWPGMRHVEMLIDGLPWRDGSVPAAVTEDEAALLAWLESRAEVYAADMGLGEAGEEI